jgi:glycosyltransferase involved in cell wall biosynthesis
MESALRILCLCFYFEPDLSAGSFKNSALTAELAKQLPEGSQVDVITTWPNRYASFVTDALEDERRPNMRIRRIRLPAHQSGMADQSRAFIKYALGVLEHTRHESYDLVYASSSRLMMSVLGAWVSRRQKIPLYLDIRDLFVDTIKDVLPGNITTFAMPIFAQLENWAVRRASHINVVSGGFVPYFSQHYPDKNLSQFTNGIDQEFLDVAPVEAHVIHKPEPEVLYAGNMGEGQGLHHIIPGLAKRFEGRLNFRLVGAGGRQVQLQQALDAAGVTNVTLQAPVSRNDLVKLYEQADILFLHLNDFDAFKKVLPSKIFEYGALGKPVWAGVGGYAAEFIRNHMDNAAVFPPCDVEAAVKSLAILELKVAPRTQFVEQFNRHSIIARMAREIISFVEPASVVSAVENKSGV